MKFTKLDSSRIQSKSYSCKSKVLQKKFGMIAESHSSWEKTNVNFFKIKIIKAKFQFPPSARISDGYRKKSSNF